MKTNPVNWFEVPVAELERAVRFYEAMLNVTLKREHLQGQPPMAIFLRGEAGGVGGALIKDERVRPSADGSVVYFHAGKDLAGCVERAQRAGGKVLLPPTEIGDPGAIALVLDTEGNRVGLHSPRA